VSVAGLLCLEKRISYRRLRKEFDLDDEILNDRRADMRSTWSASMARFWLRARLDTAPQFCGPEIGNPVPYRRQRGIQKGGRRPSHTSRLPRPSA
jgi:hypothetical protein